MGTLTCVDNSANLVVENAFQLSPPPVVSLAQDGELLRVHVLQPEEDRDKLQPVRVGRMLIGSNTWRKCEVERQSAPSP
jgi:small nuclear ribonucleoprotein (snRNP)-like protein